MASLEAENACHAGW